MSRIALLDGGMGQELLKRAANPPSPLWSAQVLLDEPEIVEAVHLDYIRAGARIITLNAYSVTPERLERDGDATMFAKLQARAISLAKKARDRSGKDVAIAGCLPPLVASYRPDITPDETASLSLYRQIVAEQQSHVDLFLCETLASVREADVATRAAVESGLPVWTSMTVVDGDGSRLRSGEPLQDGIAAATKAGASAVLVNCSWPESLGQSLPLLAKSGLPFGAYANGFTSIDKLKPGGTVEKLTARTDLDPEAYAKHVMSWVKAGATIVGGCCETGPGHIAEIARQLDQGGHVITGAGI